MEKPIYEIWGPELFDKIWSSTSFNTIQTRLIVKALSLSTLILDLGTGIGNIAKKLVENGKNVYGLDINQQNLDYTTRKINSPRFHPVFGDALKLDYREDFDGVSCASNMAYFRDLPRIVAGIYRALKPEGLLAITGYEADKMQEWARFTGEESRKAIEKAKIILSNEELPRLLLDFVK